MLHLLVKGVGNGTTDSMKDGESSNIANNSAKVTFYDGFPSDINVETGIRMYNVMLKN